MNDGGPAFPVGSDLGPASNIVDGGYGGMSVRDYFAAKALQGWLSGCDIDGQLSDGEGGSSTFNRAALAEECYAFADAMLAERSKVK